MGGRRAAGKDAPLSSCTATVLHRRRHPTTAGPHRCRLTPVLRRWPRTRAAATSLAVAPGSSHAPTCRLPHPSHSHLPPPTPPTPQSATVFVPPKSATVSFGKAGVKPATQGAPLTSPRLAVTPLAPPAAASKKGGAAPAADAAAPKRKAGPVYVKPPPPAPKPAPKPTAAAGAGLALPGLPALPIAGDAAEAGAVLVAELLGAAAASSAVGALTAKSKKVAA